MRQRHPGRLLAHAAHSSNSAATYASRSNTIQKSKVNWRPGPSSNSRHCSNTSKPTKTSASGRAVASSSTSRFGRVIHGEPEPGFGSVMLRLTSYNFTFIGPLAVIVVVVLLGGRAKCCKICCATAVTSEPASNKAGAQIGDGTANPAATKLAVSVPGTPIHTESDSPLRVTGKRSWPTEN